MADSLRLFVFDGGTITTQGVRFLNRDGREEMRDMADPNRCFLIEHPDGLLMWDTGLPDSIAGMPGQVLEQGRFRFGLQRTLASQLAETGFEAQAVDWLAFSHLQIDHAGNTGLFQRARTLVQSREYALAFSPEAQDWGYQVKDYDVLAGQEVIQLDGDRDVFGDGQVMILSAPGHTPGHQVLYVRLPKSGAVLLSGDLYYAEKDPVEGWMPAWNTDREQTLQTMARLQHFAAEHQARWLINHSREMPPALRWE